MKNDSHDLNPFDKFLMSIIHLRNIKTYQRHTELKEPLVIFILNYMTLFFLTMIQFDMHGYSCFLDGIKEILSAGKLFNITNIYTGISCKLTW